MKLALLFWCLDEQMGNQDGKWLVQSYRSSLDSGFQILNQIYWFFPIISIKKIMKKVNFIVGEN